MQAAIEPVSPVPDVWLTSFWGYDPATWGCVGFTYESERRNYLDNSTDGSLFAVYVTGNPARPESAGMHGNVVGIMEMSRTTGFAEDFIAPEQLARMHAQISAGKWRYSVKVRRAWRIVPEEWTAVAEVAPLSYRPGLGRHISRRGVRLHPSEAERMLRFTLEEVDVFGGPVAPVSRVHTATAPPGPAR